MPPSPLNAEDPARRREEYLRAAADKWGMLRLDEAEGAPQIPLTDVFVLLQAAQREAPRPLQPDSRQ